MRIFFLSAAVLCILYYFILAVYSRKFTSTFAGFWLAAGGVHLILGCLPPFSAVGKIASVLAAGAWLISLGVELRILGAVLFSRREKADCIIVLGAQVRGRKVTDSLRRRLDQAVEYLTEFPGTRVIVSGGRGPGEDVAEADAMAEYLIGKGVPESLISRERFSASTRENLRYSGQYADIAKERMGIVTNGFHIYRASLIAKEEGYRNVCMIPAASNPVYQLNYLAREFFALIQFFILRRHRRKRGK